MDVMQLLIPAMVLIPLLGGFSLLLIPPTKAKAIGQVSLLITLVVFALSIVLAASFDWSDAGRLQFAAAAPWIPGFGLSFSYGVDGLTIWFVLLIAFLMPLVILETFKNVETRTHGRTAQFFFWLLLAEAAMTGAFIATDLIFFYVCFEFTLVPLFFLIGIYGGSQRLKAARMYFLYSFAGSMLMLASLLYLARFNAALNPMEFAGADLAAYPALGRWSFDIFTLTRAAQEMSAVQQGWVLLGIFAGLAVKVPMFPVHTWLPLAHTEAPTPGSVILAAVLLKLGTYGILRFGFAFTPIAVVNFAPYMGVLAVMAIIYTSLICWVQKDVKKLIAYSSVAHMGFCILGLFALNNIGVGGSVVYMINHGLSTGALFLCVGMIYERFHTREMNQMGGLVQVMPVWSFFMVFFCLSSVGLPGLNGFVGEFLTLLGAFNSPTLLGPTYAVFAGTGMILAAIYILYLVGKIVFGPIKIPSHGHDAAHAGGHHHHAVSDLDLREIVTLAPIAIVCLFIGLYPQPLLQALEAPINQLAGPARQHEAALAAAAAQSQLAAAAQSQLAVASDSHPAIATDAPDTHAWQNNRLAEQDRSSN
jgi:NADH-quinone oxidoreductase subunit M